MLDRSTIKNKVESLQRHKFNVWTFQLSGPRGVPTMMFVPAAIKNYNKKTTAI